MNIHEAVIAASGSICLL